MTWTTLAKTIRITSWVIVLTVMAVTAALVAARWQGYEVLSVQSDSMVPAIRKGDAVLVQTRQKAPRAGSVITYHSLQDPRATITHRVVSVDTKRGLFQAQGDASPTPDPAVPFVGIVGTVRHALPRAGVALDALRHPLGLAAVIYLPVGGIIASEVHRLARHYRFQSRRHYIAHYYAEVRLS